MSQLGLHQLVAPEDAKHDIVFVHGLFGNRINTWTADKGPLWPQTFLSQDIPDARIFTFGYDADVTKLNLNEELTEGTMESHAADLCQRLSGFRAVTESSDRPLIFVAHSLGGLICAQLVVKGALAGETDNIAIISNNTRGMIFLGTPFHGSPIAPFAKVFSSMVSVLHKTHTQKVKDLEQKSEKLRILAESFASALNQRIRENQEIRVAFFHETKKYLGVLVVPELNSRIPGFGDHASINANHSEMCKFSNPEDPGYQSVVAAIRKMAADLDGKGPDASAHSVHYANTYLGNIKNQVNGNQTIHGGMHFA
ncbi:Alpha/Beta hydrolase protein [Corynascus novoguineensis]|uniref:Alpha/Beta hydrolase protein n=1 Tax=Corynascus novoguineensis TaxID=1126955 RepID=A0AAN7HPX7_9PEZI|nr:Alpha/Beta hydrolase protein [Corynascus novoguineensis]